MGSGIRRIIASLYLNVDCWYKKELLWDEVTGLTCSFLHHLIWNNIFTENPFGNFGWGQPRDLSDNQILQNTGAVLMNRKRNICVTVCPASCYGESVRMWLRLDDATASNRRLWLHSEHQLFYHILLISSMTDNNFQELNWQKY